jgi:hypothetical protein
VGQVVLVVRPQDAEARVVERLVAARPVVLVVRPQDAEVRAVERLVAARPVVLAARLQDAEAQVPVVLVLLVVRVRVSAARHGAAPRAELAGAVARGAAHRVRVVVGRAVFLVAGRGAAEAGPVPGAPADLELVADLGAAATGADRQVAAGGVDRLWGLAARLSFARPWALLVRPVFAVEHRWSEGLFQALQAVLARQRKWQHSKSQKRRSGLQSIGYGWSPDIP